MRAPSLTSAYMQRSTISLLTTVAPGATSAAATAIAGTYATPDDLEA